MSNAHCYHVFVVWMTVPSLFGRSRRVGRKRLATLFLRIAGVTTPPTKKKKGHRRPALCSRRRFLVCPCQP